MIKNYFVAALRHLRTNKAYSALNIVGLSIGMACAALIFLWVEDELHFDGVNLKKDRLYLALQNQQYDAGIATFSSTPAVMGPAMQKEIPGIVNACRVTDNPSLLFSVGDKSMFASGKYAEPALFSMFTLSFVQGNAKTAFSQLHSLVITEKTAKKFFGDDKNVLGKTVRVNNKQDYVIGGVVKDNPGNASLQFEWVAPFEIWWKQQRSWADNWGNNCIYTYAELAPGADVTTINKQLYNFIQQRAPRSISHAFLFGMNDWHLRWDFSNGKQAGGGQIEYVRLFSIIAWIVLIIACINFMNLATARSEKRAREVGVRKVMGAGKKGLLIQFMGEALLMALLAAVCSLIIVSLVLPGFNMLVQKDLSLDIFNPVHILALLSIILICGLVAGSYPSFYLSSFNPVFVLKGIKLKTGSAAWIRKGLVVVQFTVSLVLIVATIIIYQQIQHVKNRGLGFNKNNLLEISVRGGRARHFPVIKQDLLNTGVAEDAALSDHVMLYGGNNTDGITWAGKNPGSKILISGRYVTPDFFNTMGMHIIEGRNLQDYDSSYADGTSKKINLVITASLAKLMGGGSAIGKTMHNEGDTSTTLSVVGVVNDYVYGDMYGKPDPVGFMWLAPRDASFIYVRMKATDNTEQALAKVEAVMKKHDPLYPVEYRFVDDQFNQLFLSEALVSKLSRIFAALAILISCLGLFGLAAYTAERRTKEIGIRKVLGAGTVGLAGLLSKDFLQLVLLSCLLAFPLAGWMMQHWLKGYAYRITINAWVFVIAGIAALLIAMATISFQSIRAALANPVKSLRSE